MQFCLPPGVCMVPCAPPLIRVREVPVIVRRIKYVDHIWEPDRQRPVISEDDLRVQMKAAKGLSGVEEVVALILHGHQSGG